MPVDLPIIGSVPAELASNPSLWILMAGIGWLIWDRWQIWNFAMLVRQELREVERQRTEDLHRTSAALEKAIALVQGMVR